MISAVIFDLDGTLVHSLPGIAASLNRTLQQASLPMHPEHKVRDFIGDGMRVLIERALPSPRSDDELDDMVDYLKNDYASTWQDGTTPYSGTTEMLVALTEQKIDIAVLSNKPHIFCQKITDTLFPDTIFSAVLGQRDTIAAKPDPSGAIELAHLLNTPCSDIAFLGDSTIDLITAQNADMIPIAATWGYHDPPALEAHAPAYTIAHISELLPIINNHT